KLDAVIGKSTSLEAPDERRRVLLTALQMHHLALVCRGAGIQAFYDRKGGDFFESEEGRLTVMDWGVTVGFPHFCPSVVAVLRESGALTRVDNLEVDRVFPDDSVAFDYVEQFLVRRLINAESPSELLGLSSLVQDVQDRLSKWPLFIKLPLFTHIADSLDPEAFRGSDQAKFTSFFQDSARAVNYYGQLLWMREAESSPSLVVAVVGKLKKDDQTIPWSLLAAEAMTERGFTKAAQQLSDMAEDWEKQIEAKLTELFQIGV
ncbi:hypothetical protein CO015_02040, partial [candidate division WWE3 bacterium CG_4_8_14_3_um_filter_42_11]